MTFIVMDRALSTMPGHWERVEIRRVATLRRETNADSTATLLSLSASDGVRPRPDDGGRQLPSADTVANYWLVRPSDLVFNPMWALEGGVAVSATEGAVSTAYRVYQFAIEQVEPQFVHYLLRSLPALEQYRAMVRGVTTFDRSVTREDFEAMPIGLPPIREQRAIADFLDAETTRIDALIEKKRRQQTVLLEHEEAVLLDRLGDWRNESDRTLRQYGATAVTGPFGTQLAASEYVSGGTPVINPTHIERGRFEPEEEITVSSQVAARLKRHRLFEGDIVLGRKGDVGRSAIVTAKEVGWICGSDSIALRTDKTQLIPEFLVRLMSIDLYRQQLQATSTGTTMANVNQATLLGLRLPALSVSEQGDRLVSAERAIARHEALIMTLDKQIELLTEHRQALITAAVTGQLEVPGAGSS